jgi:hypothetical protein
MEVVQIIEFVVLDAMNLLQLIKIEKPALYL